MGVNTNCVIKTAKYYFLKLVDFMDISQKFGDFCIYILVVKWWVIYTLLLNCNAFVVGKMLNDAFKPSLSLFRFISQARMRYFNFFHSHVISLLAYIYLATHATNSSHHIKFLFTSSSTFCWVFILLVITIFHTNFEVRLFYLISLQRYINILSKLKCNKLYWLNVRPCITCEEKWW